MTRFSRTLGAAAAGLLALVAGACKEDAPDFKTLALSGTVENIDLTKHRVKISFYSEKHGRLLTEEAEVTKRTEVFINGIAARLEDVKEGELAEGEVLMTGQGDQRAITITKVHIRRAAAVLAPTSQPAGMPHPVSP